MTLSKIISKMFLEIFGDIRKFIVDIRDGLKSDDKDCKAETIDALIGGAIFAISIPLFVILFACIAR